MLIKEAATLNPVGAVMSAAKIGKDFTYPVCEEWNTPEYEKYKDELDELERQGEVNFEKAFEADPHAVFGTGGKSSESKSGTDGLDMVRERSLSRKERLSDNSL